MDLYWSQDYDCTQISNFTFLRSPIGQIELAADGLSQNKKNAKLNLKQNVFDCFNPAKTFKMPQIWRDLSAKSHNVGPWSPNLSAICPTVHLLLYEGHPISKATCQNSSNLELQLL